MKKTPLISVVAPFYNEEDTTLRFHSELTRELNKLNKPYELIYIDDGSTDTTLQLLRQVSRRDPKVSIISFTRNFGLQTALSAGIKEAQGDIIITLDSDLQHPPSLVVQMLKIHAAGNEVVCAVRQKNQTPVVKRFLRYFFYKLLKAMTKIEVVEGAGGYRLLSRKVVDVINDMPEMHRFIPGMVAWTGFQYAVIYYDEPNRFAGKTKFSTQKSLHMAVQALFSFSTIPLQVISLIGLLMLSLSTVYLTYIIFITFFGHPIQGWPSLIAINLIIGGMTLLSFGVIAQYISMIFEEIKQRPKHVIKYKKMRAKL